MAEARRKERADQGNMIARDEEQAPQRLRADEITSTRTDRVLHETGNKNYTYLDREWEEAKG